MQFDLTVPTATPLTLGVCVQTRLSVICREFCYEITHSDDCFLTNVAVDDVFPKHFTQEWSQLKNEARSCSIHTLGLPCGHSSDASV